MNIQQLEYLIAIDEYRHFAKAADYCEVTQPTLSTMVQRLEDELAQQQMYIGDAKGSQIAAGFFV